MAHIFRITVVEKVERTGYFVFPDYVLEDGLWMFIDSTWPTFDEMTDDLPDAQSLSWEIVTSIPEGARVFSTHDREEDVCTYMIGSNPIYHAVFVNGNHCGNWIHGKDPEECAKSFFEVHPSLVPYQNQIEFCKRFGFDYDPFSKERAIAHLRLVRAKIIMTDGTEIDYRYESIVRAFDLIPKAGVRRVEIDVLPGGELSSDAQ